MNKIYQSKNKVMKRIFVRYLMIIALLVGGTGTAIGQTTAVIMNGNYFLTHNEAGSSVNSAATTSFNPATCLWVYARRDYIRTADSDGNAISNNNNYLQYSSLSLGSDWGNWYRGNSGENIYHRVYNLVYTYYYLRRDNTTWQINSTNSNVGRPYNVTINTHNAVDNITNPTISISSVSGSTINFSHTNIGGTYTPAYTTYNFNNANHQWWGDSDHGTTTPSATNANTLSPTYTWSLTADGGGVATIDAQTGVLTLSGSPTGNITVLLTVSNISPVPNKTVDFTLEYHDVPQSVNVVATLSTPTITPNSISLDYGEGQIFTTSATATTTTTTTPAYVTLTKSSTTYYYYDGALHDSAPDSEVEVTNPTPSYSWAISGAASGNLTLSSTTGTTTTVNYANASQNNANATLTITASTPGSVDKQNTATITVTRTMPTDLDISKSTVNLCAEESETVAYTLTPVGAYDNVSVSSSDANVSASVDNAGTLTLTAGASATVTPATITLTATGANSTTLTTTVTVNVKTLWATPTFSFDNSNNKVTITHTSGSTVRYTTNGDTPTEKSNLYNDSEKFVQATPATIKAIAYGDDHCPSAVASTSIEKVETPTITITSSGVTFSTTSGNATFYYTTDGTTTPTMSTPTTWTTGSSAIAPANFTDGKDIKVIATISGMISSAIATKVYHPASGISGSTVILNDLEPHYWAYYSDNACPVRSLNPADVKITYYGNGTGTVSTSSDDPANNSWTADATGVKVSPSEVAPTENQNTFVYFKTLERTDGRTSNNPTGRCAYTVIPNPFQVRPIYSTTSTRNIYVQWAKTNSGTGTLVINYINSAGEEATFTKNYDSQSSTNLTIKMGTDFSYSLTCTGTQNNSTATVTIKLDNGSGTQIRQATANYEETVSGVCNTRVSDASGYRGFYKWRIKDIKNGAIYTDSTGGTEKTAYESGDYSEANCLNAEETYYFAPSGEYNMEVELEALWARAYVVSTGNNSSVTVGNYSVGYERNFVVIEKSSTNFDFSTAISGKGSPFTVSRYYPNGATGTTTNSAITGTVTLEADTKFENISFYNMGSSTMSAAGHDLIIGRGCSGTVQNLYGQGSSGMDYMLRIESGIYTNYYALGFYSSYTTFSGTNKIRSVLGCDYDRALGPSNGGNDNLTITGKMYMGQRCCFSSSSNGTDGYFKCWVKSGDLQNGSITNGDGGDETFYLGTSGSQNTSKYIMPRYLYVEGGQLAGVAGGLDDTVYTNASDFRVYLRMTGGYVRGCVYGAGSYARGAGERRYVITGGEIGGWVAAGCNGIGSSTTNSNNGAMIGDSYVYIGGNAAIGYKDMTVNSVEGGNVFGAGRGAPEDSYPVGTVKNSNVVIADKCRIEKNVYGGGNYGYTLNDAKLYIVGGTVDGNIFGGANMTKGKNSTFYVKGGDVKGGVFGGCFTKGTLSSNVIINVSDSALVENGVFGGGYGTESNSCDVSGTVTITMTGGNVLYGLYGGGNVRSTISQNVTMQINGGQVGTSSSNANIHGGAAM